MNRNFIFVFILLVTLSVVNAAPSRLDKRDTGFIACSPPSGTPTPVLISVTYTPVPLASGQPSKFDVSGTLKEDIGSITRLFIGFFDRTDPQKPVPIKPFPSYFKTFTTEIIEAGNPFNTTAQFTVPTLPASYTISVLIMNPPNDIPGCAIERIGAPPSSLSSYPIASYPFASYPIASVDSYPIAEK
ncbi:hypothetical protein Glove_444g22 [Diversispora epigaea]|uniref:MD-2-related lipid-recognition domain-containing protein n=1 Tax=Diversispora epigaea TaxID=1348612 RepID=A0A397GUJ5_9GLOM|nr:hypothetical protein Glove_444g22 [Diversispora epigaea]